MKKYLGIIAVALLIVAGSVFLSRETSVNASVSQGGEYTATTTVTSGTNYVNGVGSFGSVIITGPYATGFSLYDATSTQATSTSNLIATFPASAPAGTYTFDVRVINGLKMSNASTTNPTMTITYRQY